MKYFRSKVISVFKTFLKWTEMLKILAIFLFVFIAIDAKSLNEKDLEYVDKIIQERLKHNAENQADSSASIDAEIYESHTGGFREYFERNLICQFLFFD